MSSGRNHNSLYTLHNKIQLIKDGSQYLNLLKELIEKAKVLIYTRINIRDDDATGTLIADQLIKAAQKNVAVKIIADGYASQYFSRKFIKHLIN